MRAWIVPSVIAVCFAVVPTPQAARASTAASILRCDKGGCSHYGFRFIAGAGETNRVTVTREPDFLVIRDEAGVQASISCAQIDQFTVRCNFEQRYQESVARFFLGDGNDVLDASEVSVRTGLDGGAGDDRMIGPSGAAAHFVAGPGNDRMVGGRAIDSFGPSRTRDGSDTMVGGGAQPRPFASTWYGDSGDTVRYFRGSRPVRVDMTAGRDDGERGERDAVVGMETVKTSSGNDVLVGTAAAERLRSGGGHDILRGGGGADDLDTEDPDKVWASAQAGLDDVLDGGNGPDLLNAGTGADRLIGGSGRDQIDGGAGRDRVTSADRGPDWVLCGSGADRLLADANDFRTSDCERSSGGRPGGTSLLAASVHTGFPDWYLLVQVGCANNTDCAGRLGLELQGREIAEGSFFVLPHDTGEARLFPRTRGAGEPPTDLAEARLTLDGESVPLAALPRYRITQSLKGIR